MKHKAFQLPKPILIKEAKSKSINQNCNSMRMNRIEARRRKGTSKAVLARPKFKRHICQSEPNCSICREYINRLDEWRKKER